jgi:hypothetical protein
MSDLSKHTTQKRIVVSVGTRESPQTGETTNQVRDDFQQPFGQEAPSKQPFLRWEQLKNRKAINQRTAVQTGRGLCCQVTTEVDTYTMSQIYSISCE